MPQTRCGFDNQPGVSGSNLLSMFGPTLLVDIGFDPSFKIQTHMMEPGVTVSIPSAPAASIKGVEALVDTGAGDSCIDSLLASQLNLPIIDKQPISGIGGQQEADIHLAQIHVPSLAFTLYGVFAAVHLSAGGQRHKALIGRSFLRHFTMVYEGKTGTVTISSE